MYHIHYNFLDTLQKDIDGEFYTTQTGTYINNSMGVWGRVVLDKDGNICEEDTSVRLEDRIYYYRLSTKI